jgi:D-serine deaminase-like pyridoxal phosphate-dependent protein
MDPWYHAGGVNEIPTPALIVFPERIEENIRRMISMAGGPDHLRPHVKTHKMAAVVKIKISNGIGKFKCSTLAEAEMVARCNGKDIMLAMQPVGPHIDGYFKLQLHYTGSRFSALADSPAVAEQLAAKAAALGLETDVWLDINNGMDRTGIRPGKEALLLYQKISNLPCLKIRGLHVYDGHIHDEDIRIRRRICERDFQPVYSLIEAIREIGPGVPAIVAGGTPTFPIHAGRRDTETSPGTCVLWDSGYHSHFPDLSFLHAAVLITRVVSKPGKDLLCLDLGHKAIAAEMPHPRVTFPEVPVKRFVNHSEEHLVVETQIADQFEPGDVIYGIPWHICPTVPRYKSAYTVVSGKISGEWQIDARDRMITL